jgi:hypothetical protein
MRAPERYVFTFALSCAAVLFAVSAYLLFRHLQDRFQDVADFYYGFAHEHVRRKASVGGASGDAEDYHGEGDGGRYDRERIVLLGSERVMLSFLPKANYVALGLSLLACACLLFLAVVDLKEARYYHGSASAMFFVLGIMQGLFLTSLTYALWRVETAHSRRSNLHFYAKVFTLFLCLFCTFPLALVEGLVISLAKLPLGDVGLHNVGTINQYLLTLSLLLHFFCYSCELGAVDVAFHLQFDAPDRIIALGGSSSRATRSNSSFFEEDDVRSIDAELGGRRFSNNTNVISLNAGEEDGYPFDDHGGDGEAEAEEEEPQGIRFVNKGSSNSGAGREMHEIIPVEVLDLSS